IADAARPLQGGRSRARRRVSEPEVNEMRYEPLYDRVIVKLLKPDDRTESGLYIPQMAHDGTPYLTAEVIAVGAGRITSSGSTVPLSVKVGDVIVFFRSQSSGEQMV